MESLVSQSSLACVWFLIRTHPIAVELRRGLWGTLIGKGYSQSYDD